ncbi:glutamine cyclotransferase [Hanstruepera neustonica]|uniref:Glutamine cyclotransferase n=1 Tax=Hanstruepera neustonica TaxID=1445657 RepID=A0A2K1DXC9_9FLAO|nr:glutaminyl-peptide cyclotransferase [Hanstruepera neustonica]PNQ72653.1 glutamine cyclotransferase [Hanstruepera neustonica]
MTSYKYLTIIFLGLIVISCGSNVDVLKKDISIVTNSANNAIEIGNKLELTLKNPKNHEIKGLTFTLDGNPVSSSSNLTDLHLGTHDVIANFKLEGEDVSISESITVLNNQSPTIYTFNIINEYPHDMNSYTQGLEFYKGELYEGTGQYRASKLRKVDYKTGEVLKNIDLANEYFGEGITILNDKIYQLTWKKGTGFVYDVNTFEKTGSFRYGNSLEGWGICNDGTKLYKSDGTEKIWTLNPETLVEEGFIQAYHNKGKVVELNELEWINGKIYANRWNKNGVAIINPNNGAVEGVIDFTPLKDQVTQHPRLDVLNGLAYNPETKTLFVTGKYWDKLFEVEIVEK